MARPVHPLVSNLATKLDAPAIGNVIQKGTVQALNAASNLTQVVLFAGFLGGDVRHDNKTWQVLYTDLELTEYLLIEDNGILADSTVEDDNVPFKNTRDVLWLKADTPVVRGASSQSVEAQFLTGAFTRAGDFQAPLTGGTLAAATGVFCEARTPSCCGGPSRPRPRP